MFRMKQIYPKTLFFVFVFKKNGFQGKYCLFDIVCDWTDTLSSDRCITDRSPRPMFLLLSVFFFRRKT